MTIPVGANHENSIYYFRLVSHAEESCVCGLCKEVGRHDMNSLYSSMCVYMSCDFLCSLLFIALTMMTESVLESSACYKFLFTHWRPVNYYILGFPCFH